MNIFDELGNITKDGGSNASGMLESLDNQLRAYFRRALAAGVPVLELHVMAHNIIAMVSSATRDEILWHVSAARRVKDAHNTAILVKQKWLLNHGYFVGRQDSPGAPPDHTGRVDAQQQPYAFLVCDPQYEDGFCIAGNNLDKLIEEAHDRLNVGR